MNPNKDCDENMGDNKVSSSIGAEESMSTLILWNISKALQRNPNLDLKAAIKDAHDRLDNTRDVNKIITQSPEERHLACALLAWQELGHSSADSLYRFIEDKLNDHDREASEKIKQNTKIRIISPSDKSATSPQCYRTLDHSETTDTPKAVKCTYKGNNKGAEPELSCSHKPDPTINNHITHSKHIYESTPSSVKCTHLGDKAAEPSPLKCKKDRFTNLTNLHVSNNKYEVANESSYCVLKNTRKKELLNVLKCPFMSAAYNPKNVSEADDCVDCDSCEHFDTNSLKGPVVTLPPETKVVMRFEGNQSPCARHQGKRPRAAEKDIMSKIDAACCMDSGCAERLAELDKATTELRNRAARLARREAERAELLERAEAAWKDLELGYQRRLILAEEKEYDMAKQTKKLIEDRNGYKTACMNLAKVLKDRGEATEKTRQTLVQVEKEMCALACVRMRQSEEAARSDAAINEQQIKVSQLDRDLQFKEEQTRRKLSSIQNEIESVRALTVEAERAMRAELSALREQVETVSKQLLREDNENNSIKTELEKLRSEKMCLVEDLEGCQVSCDLRQQKKMDELKKGRERLTELKEKVMECKCKIPIDASVEVKRTPSLAALCTCSPEDRLLESCSCTSLRSQLLSNMLSDLFGGLQAELGDVAAQMPCQYLKCLEDRHNWEKGSLVKSNLRSYFSKLLIGELDIAIATAIEKYHARWVGISCVDTLRSVPDTDEVNTEGWQARAIERRAQKLASKLAEQLFQEKADELVQRAKDVVKSGPPPCECKETAVFPCLIKPPAIGSGGLIDNNSPISTYWRKTYKDVTQLRVQIEDLKKDSLKKEDLKLMEEKIYRMVQRPSDPETPTTSRESQPKEPKTSDINNAKDTKCHNRSVNTETASRYSAQLSRPTSIRKKNMDIIPKKNPRKLLNEQPDRSNKIVRKTGPVQAFAVNTCFCGNQNVMSKLISEDSQKNNTDHEDKTIRKPAFSKNISNQLSNSKHSKPISGEIESTQTNLNKNKKSSSCPSDCVCFHKMPSNTSIDKLLEKLTKWRCDLVKTSQEHGDKSNTLTHIEIENTQQLSYEFNKSTSGIQSNIIYQANAPVYSDNLTNQNVTSDDQTNLLPNTTESEYMGAINLDKSNDHCKCTGKQQKVNKNKSQAPSSVFKCINSELCECKKSSEKKSNTLQIDNKIVYKESSKKNRPSNDLLLEPETSALTPTVDDKQNYQMPLKAKADENIKGDHNSESSINNTVKTSELFSCDCDYYIKLLGVTLANISSHQVFNDKQVTSNRKYRTEIMTSNDIQTVKTSSNKAKSDNGEFSIQSCQCHVQFDEFKNYMENNFRKQLGDHSTNDKELNVPSFKEISSNNVETCICCNKNGINESQELEVNTFYLLEEHLRGKLEELKKSCCKYSCLPVDEEEKLFSAILERVRQIISSSTNEIKCKCKEELQSDGSWNRANTLLQEYLKTKIRKVQCLCTNGDQKQEGVLPKVLDEIYNLIEKDFQRLRNVYKFQNSDQNRELIKDEEPEKDITDNHIDTHEVKSSMKPKFEKDTEKISKSNSNTSIILKHSMSAQVTLNLGMHTKSCDAMEKGTKILQTCESDQSLREKGFNSVETENCDCNTNNYGKHDILVNHHICSLKNFAEKKSSPYIGYTVDCSCKCALGTCTCIKSTVMRHNDEINNLWNDLTKDNIQSKKYSYIMNSTDIPRNHPVDTKGLEYLAVNTKHQTSKCIESDFSDEEIVLKDSNRNIIVSNNSANTSNGNLLITNNDLHAEETDEICKCRTIKPILKTSSIRSESHLSNSTNLHKTQSLSCTCNLVPVCHVKMLVDSIENRIYNSKCTCDSLNARVCPVHSKRLY